MGLIKYVGSNIHGECTIDDLFKRNMDVINDTAKKYKLTVIITSSKRKTIIVPGAIVAPAKMSNHLVGHAIDCNLKSDTEYFNSVKMGDGTGVDEQFIKEVQNKGVRWGGCFKAKDSVHFDSGLNLQNPKLWHELNIKYNSK